MFLFAGIKRRSFCAFPFILLVSFIFGFAWQKDDLEVESRYRVAIDPRFSDQTVFLTAHKRSMAQKVVIEVSNPTDRTIGFEEWKVSSDGVSTHANGSSLKPGSTLDLEVLIEPNGTPDDVYQVVRMSALDENSGQRFRILLVVQYSDALGFKEKKISKAFGEKEEKVLLEVPMFISKELDLQTVRIQGTGGIESSQIQLITKDERLFAQVAIDLIDVKDLLGSVVVWIPEVTPKQVVEIELSRIDSVQLTPSSFFFGTQSTDTSRLQGVAYVLLYPERIPEELGSKVTTKVKGVRCVTSNGHELTANWNPGKSDFHKVLLDVDAAELQNWMIDDPSLTLLWEVTTEDNTRTFTTDCRVVSQGEVEHQIAIKGRLTSSDIEDVHASILKVSIAIQKYDVSFRVRTTTTAGKGEDPLEFPTQDREEESRLFLDENMQRCILVQKSKDPAFEGLVRDGVMRRILGFDRGGQLAMGGSYGDDSPKEIGFREFLHAYRIPCLSFSSVGPYPVLIRTSIKDFRSCAMEYQSDSQIRFLSDGRIEATKNRENGQVHATFLFDPSRLRIDQLEVVEEFANGVSSSFHQKFIYDEIDGVDVVSRIEFDHHESGRGMSSGKPILLNTIGTVELKWNRINDSFVFPKAPLLPKDNASFDDYVRIPP